MTTTPEQTTFLHYLAAFLGELDGNRPWRVQPAPFGDNALVVQHGPEILWVHPAKERGRLALRFHLGQELYRHQRRKENNPEITVAADRGPEAIAKEVVRRLLPEFRALYAVLAERLADQIAYENRRDAAAERMGAILGVEHNEGKLGWINLPGDVYCQQVEVSGGNTTPRVAMNVRGLTEAQAAAIFRILKEG